MATSTCRFCGNWKGEMVKYGVRHYQLDGLAALHAAEMTTMGKTKGERDTEFVKRIVCAYLNAAEEIGAYIRSEKKST